MSMYCTIKECECFYYEQDPTAEKDTCNCGHVEDEHEDEFYADFEEA